MPTKPTKGESKQDFLKRCTSESTAAGMEADAAFAACNLAWDDNKNQRSVLTLSAAVEFKKSAPDAPGKSKRQFAIAGYTGQPLETWWGPVIFSVPGMRTKEKIPVLREHARDRVVGYGKAWNDGNGFYVSGDFSEVTGDAKEVLALADEGYPWQASVGIWPRKVKVLENAKSKATVNGREISGPAEIWEESDVGEVSFVSLGRDDNTAAISFAASEGKVPVNIEYASKTETATPPDGASLPEETIMELTIEILEKEHKDIYDQVFGLGIEAGRTEGAATERARVTEILTADGDANEARRMIDDGTPAAECYKKFFAAEKKKRELGLKHMAAEAPASQGTEAPAEPALKESADVELSRRAHERAEQKGIELAVATKEIMAIDPDLRSRYRKLYGRP